MSILGKPLLREPYLLTLHTLELDFCFTDAFARKKPQIFLQRAFTEVVKTSKS